MNNPLNILETLDRHLTKPAELTIFGRAALALGFQDSPPVFATTHDVDAILPLAWLAADDENAASPSTAPGCRKCRSFRNCPRLRSKNSGRWLAHPNPRVKPPLRTSHSHTRPAPAVSQHGFCVAASCAGVG